MPDAFPVTQPTTAMNDRAILVKITLKPSHMQFFTVHK